MRPHRLFGLFGLFGLVALATGPAPGQEAKPPAAGQPGAFVSGTFRAYIVTDDRWPPVTDPATKKTAPDPKDRTNKIHDLVTENGLNPVVAIFVRSDVARLKADFEAGKFGAGKLAQEVNNLLTDKVYGGLYRGARLAGFMMFLQLEGGTKTITLKDKDGAETKQEVDLEYPDDEKRDEYAARVRELSNAVKAQYIPFGLAPTQSKSVAKFGIKPGDGVTVIIYDKLKIVKRWEFPPDGPNDEQVKEIVEAIKEMVTTRFKP